MNFFAGISAFRFKISMKSLVLAIGLTAMCFASLGLFAGGILATFFVFLVMSPTPVCWRSFECAATISWTLGIAISTSEVSGCGLDFVCFYLPIGLILGFSWLLRQAIDSEKALPRRTWLGLFLSPVACVLSIIFYNTDLAFRLRLALSEPALRAEARQIPSGFQMRFGTKREAAGLFRANAVKEKNGCVLWETKSCIFWISEGLAFVPFKEAPVWHGFSFRHIYGAWWVYVERMD